jgi:hypothetical protein
MTAQRLAEMESEMTQDQPERIVASIEELLDELTNADPNRRADALQTVHCCKQLVGLRAAANGTTAATEWLTIADQAGLDRDIAGTDPALRDAAEDVLDEMNHVLAMRAADDHVSSLDDKLWAMGVKAEIDQKIDALRAKNGWKRAPKN